MLNSSVGIKEDSPQRLRVNTRKSKVLTVDDGKKSMDITQAFEYEKMMGQTYRQRNERNIIKCKFLYNKLTALSKMEGVPEMIASEVSEVDVKIKNLQQSLLFKRSQQMKKLKKKVTAFLQQISFEIQPEDMDKIEDQIQIILLLMDIFEEKFYEMTADRKEIDEIVNRVQRDYQPTASAQYEELKNENQRLLMRITSLQGQISKLRSGQTKKISLDFNRKEDTHDYVGDQVIASKNLAIERYLKQIGDLEQEVSDLKVKLKFTEDKLDRSRREEAQWKQRYSIIQAQKNERIQLLQQSLGERTPER